MLSWHCIIATTTCRTSSSVDATHVATSLAGPDQARGLRLSPSHSTACECGRGASYLRLADPGCRGKGLLDPSSPALLLAARRPKPSPVSVGRAVGPRPMSGCATCSAVLSGALEVYPPLGTTPGVLGGGAGGGLPDISWRVTGYFVGFRSSFGVGGEQAASTLFTDL